MRASASFRCSRGVIAAVCPKPNSYLVKTDDGRSFRRNRSSIYVDKSTPVVPRAVGKPSHKNGSHWREMLDIPRRQVLVPRVPVGRVVTFEPFQQELRQAAQRDPTLTPTVNSCQNAQSSVRSQLASSRGYNAVRNSWKSLLNTKLSPFNVGLVPELN
ncbi:Uncharacterized protein APZ42_018276 [Daphnia magna]|nr:Uncharacterized protein APZ42_018276 [Daphnia magna]